MPARETDYLEAILNANVYDVAVETPLQDAPLLSERLGNRLLLKREDLQPVFSFKLRGAYNKMSRLPAAALRRGVVAASAGNHAQGVALAARRLGADATIVMPVTTPQIKVDSVAALGAGEGAPGPIAGAISNAIYNAMKVRLRDMPFTRERLISALV